MLWIVLIRIEDVMYCTNKDKGCYVCTNKDKGCYVCTNKDKECYVLY